MRLFYTISSPSSELLSTLLTYVTVQMKQLVKQFTWIEEEKKHFGKAGSSYDFGGTFNPKKSRQELEDKKARKEDLSKKVNMKAMNMLTEAENQVRLFWILIFFQEFEDHSKFNVKQK